MFKEILFLTIIFLAQAALIDANLPNLSLLSVSVPTKSNNPHLSFNDITHQESSYLGDMKSVTKEFPWVKQYTIGKVLQSTVNDKQKKLFLRGEDQKDEVVFSVFTNPDRASEVVLRQYLHAHGYTRKEIETQLLEMAELMPALKDYQLMEAWTTNSSGNGQDRGQLVMKLKKDGKEAKVYIYSKKGRSLMAVYGVQL